MKKVSKVGRENLSRVFGPFRVGIMQNFVSPNVLEMSPAFRRANFFKNLTRKKKTPTPKLAEPVAQSVFV
jgi:hypothetical protein